MAGRTTIRDVAAAAGVSVATVSRALNGHGDVGEQTRARVAAVATELGYRPSAAARTLPTGGSALVAGVVSPCAGDAKLHQPFVRAVLAAVGVALARRGRQMLTLETAAAGGYAAACRDHQVAGAVLLGFGDADDDAVTLAAGGLPVVALDLEVPGPRSTWVGGDHRGGARLAIEHLAGLGHTRIAMLPGAVETLPARLRLDGWRSALRASGLDDTLVAAGDYSAESGAAETAALLALADRPTAIVAGSDELAAGALRALHAAGLRAPDDVSVVGFDDLPLARLLAPPLTTIRQDPLAIGAAAAALLEQCVAGAAPDPAVVPVELVVRSSTSAPRQAA